MLKKFDMEDCKPISTPMVTRCKLIKENESKETDHYLCNSMIGILLYVTASRIDTMQEVGLVGRFKLHPRKHMYKSLNEYLDI
jgi:hypothetical protein